MKTRPWQRPEPDGLYDPAFEKDSCGVGFVAHVKGQRSHQIIRDADTVLKNMEHRGGYGCEPNTGDGAGMLTALPHEFLAKVSRADLGAALPPPGEYAAGLVFLPRHQAERTRCKQCVERIVAEERQRLIGWRPVPTDADRADLGETARAGEPAIEQLLIAAGEGFPAAAFERKLYIIRKRASRILRGDTSMAEAQMFYVCSLSTRLIVYKGMLTAGQLCRYYADLCDADYTSHLAMVHSRYSTNTFPSWDRAQPCRFMSHNGEINTLRGNRNWMHARQGVVRSARFGDELEKTFPILEPDCSDSGSFDNALEFLLMNGRTLQEAVLMMIPEAWQNHESMSEPMRAFYEFHSCLMEPWDGPASIVFTDGRYIGAVLDRNGLRPSRYYLTADDRVIMASEVGVLPISPQQVAEKGRLQAGKIFLIDFEQGRMIPDEELKSQWARKRPYGKWLNEQRIELSDLDGRGTAEGFSPETLAERMRAHGYTNETMQFMLLPMVQQKRDPVGSMGNDAALACLSDQPRLVYDYFKQLFAQVTNPPIDSIREEIIMSLECYIGPERNLLETTAEHANRLRIPHPILTNEELAAIKGIDRPGWKTRVIDITFAAAEGAGGLTGGLDRVCHAAEAAVDEGSALIVLSDRSMDACRAPLPALLACGAVHQHLVRQAKRTRIGLLVESGEAREVHHHCLLVGYGADAVNPYLAFEALWQARRDGRLADEDCPDDKQAVEAYRKAAAKGILKIMGKMGISTLQSYKGAQIFEAVGIHEEVVQRCFAGTPSRIQGVGFKILAEEALRRHTAGYPREAEHESALTSPGEFHWRPDGERHIWNPETLASIQTAVRTNRREAYQRFAELVNRDARARCTLRGLMRLKEAAPGGPIPLEEVEPAKEIVKRFCTGAMSFGSISPEAHTSLAEAMNALGGKSNTGEGGEDPARIHPLADGSINPQRSAIKQVASGRFGVTIYYLANADELQIKMAQGAKPGEGGELPGHKVDQNIARIRHATPGVGLISPPPHHDIYSIEDLKQLIHDLKCANPQARVSVKLVAETGVGTVAVGVAKALADQILISGHDGGTGASPWTSIKHAGLPWELGLAETHQTLVLNDLRSRVVLQTDGGLRTGRDVVIAALLGAEEFGFATAPLIALGCIMMRKCHLNTCPVGVATQDPELRKKFAGKPEHVINYFFMVAEDARQIMARLGFRTIGAMVGRVDLLEIDDSIRHWKSDGLDLAAILAPARKKNIRSEVVCTRKQDHRLRLALDNELIRQARPAIRDGKPVRLQSEIRNTDLAVGAMLSHEIVKRWGEPMLPDDTIRIRLEGSAGQSLGAFLAKGVTLELEGDANDYVGKGLSGGKIIVYPPRQSRFDASKNILVGNVVLYGATGGRAFFRGRAAERFGVRNSGAETVVEGVGDHGCEYMTGGRAVILGPTGRNFAAGMSGGIAYVWDPGAALMGNCNLAMVELERLVTREEIAELKALIQLHQRYTGSLVARGILDDWDAAIHQFVKVMPIEYKRILAAVKEEAVY
ncbi:MAG: glutamate synthase large subunit [Pirellulaceae bacterium]|nr:glutamate synthase large subunit [Thermoguttaceae bacterium]NLZ00512.1 glutamate synthase large subunit [Pirellulaceae bacterium]